MTINQTKRLNKIIEKINMAKSIAIFTHIGVDPDGLGSMFGLGEFLKSIGKRVEMLVDSKIDYTASQLFDPSMLSFQPSQDNDLAIFVDCNTAERLGEYAPYIFSHKNSIRLDHHEGYFKVAKLELTLPFSSCCEAVLMLIESMGKTPSKKVATYLLAGLTSDSDMFSTMATNKNSHFAAAKLLELGADNYAATQVSKSITPNQFALYGQIIKNSKVYDDIIISHVTAKEFRALDCDKSAADIYNNRLIDVAGMRVSCLIKELSKNLFRCSLRSRGDDVRAVAQAFSGGGHKCAAACKIKGSLKQVEEKILKEIRKNL